MNLDTLALQVCPCRTREPQPLLLAKCCGPYLKGAALAPTPEALMRSRYSAYALGGRWAALAPSMSSYLQTTWHPDTLPADLNLTPLRWTGLKLDDVQKNGDDGEVTFTAFYKESGRSMQMRERSQFLRLLGRWQYLRELPLL